VSAGMGRSRCGYCRRALHPRFDVDMQGRMVEIPDVCGCVNQGRRKAGVCQDCDAPVNGRTLYALRCATHQALRKQQSNARHDERNREERNARQVARVKRSAKVRRKKNATDKRWREANPDKVRLHNRRYQIRHSEKQRAYWREYNATRREQRRAA
jgi:hypothetical protein